MKNNKYCPPEYRPDKKGDKDYKDTMVPEIVLPQPTNASNPIPDEVPRRDGPGGE